jgi:hypothetical protein
MAAINILLVLFLSVTPLDKIEKKVKNNKTYLLYPINNTGYYASVGLYDSPNGKLMVNFPKGLPVKFIKKKGNWVKVAVTMPYIVVGWLKEENLAVLITQNTLFYSSPKLKKVMGYFKRGLVIKNFKKRGKAAEVVLHDKLPIKVYVPGKNVGTSLAKYKSISYYYKSTWRRNVYEVSPGKIFSKKDVTSSTVAVLLKKGKFKSISTVGKWVKIAPVSDYDIKFSGWIPKKRMNFKTSYYYYSHRYNFILSYPIKSSWLQGGYKLTKPKYAYIKENDTIAKVYLKKGTIVSFIGKKGKGLYEVVLRNRSYGNTRTLTSLLDAFEIKKTFSAYISSYDKMYYLKLYMHLAIGDVTSSF